ncbi:MAG: hypothetical protein J6K15_06270 [Lachnospiraceae bacterium]|nr:hypothetical protein [Lachnospiraceae bacterium]
MTGQEVKRMIDELLLERDAEMVHYSTDEAIKSHKERCDYLIALLEKQEQGLLIEAKKLKAYEETGLNPDRIEEVNELYLEKCKEVNRLEAKLEEYRDYAENVLQQLIAVSFECRGHEVGMGEQKVVAMDDVVEILKSEV